MASRTRPTRWTCGWCRVKEFTETSKPPERWVWVTVHGVRTLRCSDCYKKLAYGRERYRRTIIGVPKKQWPRAAS